MTRANVLWAICLAFALYTVGTTLFPGVVPGWIDGSALTLLVLVFALLHGAARYGWRGMLMFVAICLVVTNAMENLNILTGFPSGRYYYSDAIRPRLFQVPVIIGGAYAGAGYVSWMVAHVLINRIDSSNLDSSNLDSSNLGPSGRLAVWALPAVAAVLMVAWDLSFDPSASTLGRSWVWVDGGPYFGVPLANFFGWYLTVFLFLAPFSWYQSRRPLSGIHGRAFWAQAVVMYFLLGLRFPLIYLRSTDSHQVIDTAGHVWNAADIRATAALVTIFTMFAFALTAWLCLQGRAGERGAGR
jgi:putative membrane protein